MNRFLHFSLLSIITWCFACGQEPLRIVPLKSESAIEIPAPLTDRPEQILHRRAYTVSYNKETLQPNWVAWCLTAEHCDGPFSRKGHGFHEDPDVPKPRATPDDYYGCSKDSLSRGHMCPAGDCKWDETAQDESFLLTNCCPQNGKLNSGVWNKLETDSRRWAETYGKVYIVCGPIFARDKSKAQMMNKIEVPTGFFKVILHLGEHPAALGVIIKNNSGQKRFYNSVDDVERITKIDFFPALDDELEQEIESICNPKLFTKAKQKVQQQAR